MKKKKLALILLALVFLVACGKQEKVEEVEEETSWFQDMKTQDLDGNQIDKSMFEEYDLTLVNIWASWCPPCIMEIPELEKISNEFTNVGVKGLIVEHEGYDIRVGISPEERETVEQILDETGANYQHILVWESLLDTEFKDVESFPETVFVDSKGNFVGDKIRGARDQEQWAEIIRERLEMIK